MLKQYLCKLCFKEGITLKTQSDDFKFSPHNTTFSYQHYQDLTLSPLLQALSILKPMPVAPEFELNDLAFAIESIIFQSLYFVQSPSKKITKKTFKRLRVNNALSS